MTRQAKQDIVAQLAKRLEETSYFYIIDATGLTVEEINAFRSQCFQAGIVYQVVKNTLISKALAALSGAVDYTPFREQVLKGFSGVLIAQESGSAPAKLIKAFRKQCNTAMPLLKGAYIDSDLLVGEEHLEALSKLKSKAECIGEVIGLLQSPVHNLVATLQSGKQKLAGVMQTLANKES